MRRLLCIAFCLCFPVFAGAEVVRMSAAASLKGPLDRAIAAFEAETGTSVRVSYAASSLLARQIVQGAPADVFWSANTTWMDYLAQEGLVEIARLPLRNRIVLAGAEGSPSDIKTLCATGRVITARTDAVPLGQYARAALIEANQWPLPAGCLIETDNARTALIAVLRGEVQAGVLYASDLFGTDLVSLADLLVAEPAIYPLAAVTKNGQALVDYLISDAGRAPFLAAGFAAHDD